MLIDNIVNSIQETPFCNQIEYCQVPFYLPMYLVFSMITAFSGMFAFTLRMLPICNVEVFSNEVKLFWGIQNNNGCK